MNEAINSILKKIKKGDLAFSKVEESLIAELPSLAEEYFIAWSKEENLWHKYSISEQILDRLEKITLSPEQLSIFIKNVLFSVAKNDNYFGLDSFNLFLSFFNIEKETAKKLKEELIDFYLSDDYKITDDEINIKLITLFIEHDLKDKIAKIVNINSMGLSKSQYERYLTYCKDNGINPVFAIVGSESLQYNLENFKNTKPQIVDNLFEIYDTYKKDFKTYKNQELLLEVARELPIPIIAKDLSKHTSNMISSNLVLYEELTKILSFKKYPYDVLSSVKNVNDVAKVLDYYCFNNDELDDKVLISNIDYLDERRYFERFLETGNLLVLLQPELKDFVPEYIDVIYEKYRSNPKEQEILKKYRKPINNYQLGELLAKEGYLTYLNLDEIETITSDEDLESIKNMLTKYDVKPIIRFTLESNPKLEQIIIDSGYMFNLLDRYIRDYNPNYFFNLINNHLEDMRKLVDIRPDYILELFKKNSNQLFRTDFIKYCADFPDEVIKYIVDTIPNDELIRKIPKEFIEKYYEAFIDKVCKIYNIDKAKMDLIKNVLGPLIIIDFCDESIQNILNLPMEDLKKIINIFNTSPITMKDIENSYVSLKEFAFKTECAEDADIFNNIMNALNNNEESLFDKYENRLLMVMNPELFSRLNKKYKLEEMGYTPEDYSGIIRLISEKINIPEKREKYTTLLHEICNYYVEVKRRQFVNVKQMSHSLGLNYIPEPKMLEEKIVKYVIKQKEYNTLRHIREEYVRQGFSREIFNEVVALIDGIKDAKDLSLEAKKQIGNVKSFIYHELEEDNLIEGYKDILMELGYINKVYIIDGIDQINMIEVLKKLNINLVKELINNPNLYNNLVELFQKRKIHLLPDTVNSILGDTGVSYEPRTIAELINYFKVICEEEAKKEIKRISEKEEEIDKRIANSSSKDYIAKLSKEKLILAQEINDLKTGKIPEIRTAAALADANSFFAISSVYSYVLTPPDARIIKRNPENNSATRKIKNNERLKESVELTKLLFTRDEITIPPSNDIIESSEGKTIRVTAGNFTDPNNLTHGERTGACMRLGGVGENLFYYALKNKNGFHIKFSDPKTGNYISRITGFRRGNTVFLNELRLSGNTNYSNKELIIALRKYANNLIELSKDSSFPIENVIASNKEALRNEPTIDLHIDDINENSDFVYNDINPNSCVVLATTAKEQSFAPLNFDQNNLPIYQPIRREKRIIKTKKELSEYVNRIESVKAILNGVDYRTLSYFYHNDDFIYAIANDEWYIYVDIDGVVHKNCLSTDKRAQEEFVRELEKVENKEYDTKEEDEKWSLS